VRADAGFFSYALIDTLTGLGVRWSVTSAVGTERRAQGDGPRTTGTPRGTACVLTERRLSHRTTELLIAAKGGRVASRRAGMGGSSPLLNFYRNFYRTG
jgi:hypothetical protein